MDDIDDKKESNDNQKENRCHKPTLFTVLWVLAFIIFLFISFECIVVFYFAFAGYVFLTIFLLLYEWISLFTKDPLQMFFSILSNLSDFGLFFTLVLVCVYIIKDFFGIFSLFLKNVYNSVSDQFGKKNQNSDKNDDNNNSNKIDQDDNNSDDNSLNEIDQDDKNNNSDDNNLNKIEQNDKNSNEYSVDEAFYDDINQDDSLDENVQYENESIQNDIENDQQTKIQNTIQNKKKNKLLNKILSIFYDFIRVAIMIALACLFSYGFMKDIFYPIVVIETIGVASVFVGIIIYPFISSKKYIIINIYNNRRNEEINDFLEEYSINENTSDDNNDDNAHSINVNEKDEIIKNINQHYDELINFIDEYSKKFVDYCNNDSDETEINNFLAQIFVNIFYVSSLDGMFNNSMTYSKCIKHPLIYKIIISIIVVILQLYSLLYPIITKSVSIGQFFIYLVLRLIYLKKILCYNLIDLIINGKGTIKTIKKKNSKIIFWVTIALYIIVFIGFFVILIISKFAIFPTLNNAIYIENNDEWYKLGNNRTIKPDSFCYSKAKNDETLNTADIAILTALPRLYGTTKGGKCYIKPNLRNLFNSTMKYIFSKDYEKDKIYIICKKLTHYPYLIISSEKILNQTLKNFNDKNITLLENNQFNITNSNYFDNFSIDTLSEKEKFLYDIYQRCILESSADKCENEWDLFTQLYWPDKFSEDYEDIPGFERYQINLQSSDIIQPAFINNEDETLWSGTHYFVGGSYEDRWSVGLFIETIGRTYFPSILDNFLPLYSLIRGLFEKLFLRIEWYNRHLFYFEVSSTKEMESILSIYRQLNFTKEAVFNVGHTISGTIFKGISILTDVQGIAFESSKGGNNVNLIDNTDFIKSSESESMMTNVYSTGSIFTGNDENNNVNGILPKRYILPNVYDTACLTAISCSETKKYIPFCQQVLSTNNKNPLEEFNISFDAFLSHYGYNS